MSQSAVGDVTQLLRRLSLGEREVMPQLVDVVYAELRQIAQGRMRSEDVAHTLTPTALVHEVYVRLANASDLRFEDRQHFFAVAARAMRRVLVDHARAKQAIRRGGSDKPIPLDSLDVAAPDSAQLLEIDQALEELAKRSPRQCRIVELRYFAGLTEEQTAEALGVSRRTVIRDWSIARTWLYQQMQKSASHDA